MVNNRLTLQPRYQNDVVRHHSGVFIVNKHIPHTIQQVNTLFLLDTLNIYLPAGYEIMEKFIYQLLYVKSILKCKPQIIVTLVKSRFLEIYIEFMAEISPKFQYFLNEGNP